jgi:DNA polymerase III delta prime subunit
MSDSVLSIKLRPKNLDDLVGQESVVREVRGQFASGRIPRTYLLSGESGAGKSTLAYILALLLQGDVNRTLTAADWEDYKTWDIFEGNAADAGGIDAMRALIQTTYMLPRFPSQYKVFILNEAHKLSKPAQEALLVPTEEDGTNVWIFTTTDPKAILATLQRRCTKFKLKPLTKDEMSAMLVRFVARESLQVAEADTVRRADLLCLAGITSPGVATQALEKVASGATPEAAVDSATNELNSRDLCRELLKGEWGNLSKALETYSSDEVASLRYMLLGYLKKVVINGNGRAAQAANMITLLTEGAPAETPALIPWIAAKLHQAVHLGK